jgi:hypothetical protein
VTNMLPRERAELILADHAAGKPVRAIARTYSHSSNTVRDYVHGRRTPGEPAARPDDFGPFAAYCRQRLADDPHLRAPALQAEVSRAGFRGGTRTFYRALERHGIQPHPCPDCHIARISGYAPLAAARHPQLSPLPVPAAPVAGETLASFLGRLAAVNRTSLDALLEILPPWFRIKARWHDDRWQHDQLTPWAGEAAGRLAVLSGTAVPAIRNALPAFGARSGQPARAITACRRCTAARRIQQPVPAHLPAHHQVCLRHGIWLPRAGAPQLSVSQCPDIIAAERQARRLLRRCTIEQLIHATIRAAQQPGSPAQLPWKQRMHALITSNPRSVIESCPQELFAAAGYPETISIAAGMIPPGPAHLHEQSSLTQANPGTR